MQPALTTVDTTNLAPDFSTLASVLDALHDSLKGANQALRRFVRDAEMLSASEIAALNASDLRIAVQHLQQAVGGVDIVGLKVPARMLRAMAAAVNGFVQRPEFCSDAALHKVERASFALTDYLDAVLKCKAVSSVGLFPQYRDVLALTDDDRIHPADLWDYDWHWLNVTVPPQARRLPYDSAVRARIDGCMLKVLKTGHPPSALFMRDISVGFAANQTTLNPRVWWMACAAYFEVVAFGLCGGDVYEKRAATGVLLQYRTLAGGAPEISEQLVRDLLFFCAHAVPSPEHNTPALRAVHQAYGFASPVRVDYDKPQFGHFDSAVLAQARSQVAAATETWSGLSEGDVNRIPVAAEQFGRVAESMVTLHPDNRELAAALLRAIGAVCRSGMAPPPELDMVVATAMQYLQAAYEDMASDSAEIVQQGNRLAQQLDDVLYDAQSAPLETLTEALSRGASDPQVTASVVDELHTPSGEVETSLDAKSPADESAEVPPVVDQGSGAHAHDHSPAEVPAEISPVAAEWADEQVKIIGPLRIGIRLYNAYLNEADEWSQRLLTALHEGALAPGHPVPDSVAGLAQSLARSSATVGFMDLAELASALAHALSHTRLGVARLPAHARLFENAAEAIRQLLHQFAAGFLKHPDPALVVALKAVLATDPSAQVAPKDA